ncbi:rhomboid family intramembrane serine protease [Streptomyces aidingensis]|uniref:Membrane associated serine protease, rhomboid family n=1 Tax=Streptomyces aidingensis TaxID=910347 RepID=A0A1I1QUS3_9ACTN|nr:rhomboid family intramembrane serine protease [Streptomyces aidingensis]SFD23013.1 Membrane associated serine protease, rhomboid family [Streptomyces aidingensis]
MAQQDQQGPQPAGPAVCYRHPGRETGIRCTRCERPICPDCMIDAAVGYQCPSCVRGANRAPRPRTLAGGRVHADPVLITKILIGLNLAMFLAVLAVGDDLLTELAMIGWAVTETEWVGVADGEWYRLITAAFLHEQFWHIGFNMLALWVIGSSLEAVLGRVRFAALFLISALAGSTLQYLLAEPNIYSLGASGGVYGLFGGIAVLVRRLRADMRPILALLAVNLVITFLPGLNIAWQAHLGGLVAGAAITAGMVHAPRRGRAAVQFAVCALVLAAIVVACLVRTAQLTG